MKKTIYGILILTGLIFIACENDQNKHIDYISPKAEIEVDTFEVVRGESLPLKALLKDPSGISYISLTYPEWKINEEMNFEEGEYPPQYNYTYTVNIPDDAKQEWIEDFIKHDGTRFKIKQQYHKISLTCNDGVSNRNIFYFFIKVK